MCLAQESLVIDEACYGCRHPVGIDAVLRVAPAGRNSRLWLGVTCRRRPWCYPGQGRDPKGPAGNRDPAALVLSMVLKQPPPHNTTRPLLLTMVLKQPLLVVPLKLRRDGHATASTAPPSPRAPLGLAVHREKENRVKRAWLPWGARPEVAFSSREMCLPMLHEQIPGMAARGYPQPNLAEPCWETPSPPWFTGHILDPFYLRGKFCLWYLSSPLPPALRWDLAGQGRWWREPAEGKGGSYFLLIYLFSSFLPQVAMVIPSSLSLPSRGDGHPLREKPSVPTAPAAAFPHQRLNILMPHRPLSV